MNTRVEPAYRDWSVRAMVDTDITSRLTPSDAAMSAVRRPLPLLALGVMLVEGFCSLALELIAMRRNAANLGDTVTLTGAVLATVLLAISIGYALGGRTATRIGRQMNGLRGLRVRTSRNLLIAAALGGLAGLCHTT